MRAFTPDHLELTLERQDHTPVVLSVIVPTSRGPHWRKRRRKLIDIDALSKPENVEAISRAVEALPPIPWSVDPDTHAAQLVEDLRNIARE
eukprot:6093552-Alexandrium_andersonii.AAC.1